MDASRVFPEACVACGGRAVDSYGARRGFQLFRCRTCGSIFVHPVPPRPDELYTEEYFCGRGSCGGYTDYDRDKEAMRGGFIKDLQEIEAALGGTGRLLDVGAATGYFLELARERGWAVAGVEVSTYAVGCAKEKMLPVERGVIGTVSSAPGTFDAITLWDVFEHLNNPVETLVAARRLLRTGGILAFTTPDASSIWARLAGRRWHLLNPPEHIACYSRKGLRALLGAQGFDLVELRAAVKRFSISYILHIAGGRINWPWLRTLGRRLGASWLGRLALPLNLRDNMFVLAVRRS